MIVIILHTKIRVEIKHNNNIVRDGGIKLKKIISILVRRALFIRDRTAGMTLPNIDVLSRVGPSGYDFTHIIIIIIIYIIRLCARPILLRCVIFNTPRAERERMREKERRGDNYVLL